MILLILASGSGNRLKHLTRNNPKCLVKINNRPIINFMDQFINKFKKTFVVVGYKSKKIKEYFNDYSRVKLIKNNLFKDTNMVESIFCAKKFINDDVVIVYSDIIFDTNIYNLLKKKNNIMPVNSSWEKIWSLRMNKKRIKYDAENIVIRKNTLVSIGGKIESEFPKNQFMGIVKFLKKDFNRMYEFYKKINNKKIDFTGFIQLFMRNNNVKIKCYKTKKFWFEIDTIKDLRVAKKIISK